MFFDMPSSKRYDVRDVKTVRGRLRKVALICCVVCWHIHGQGRIRRIKLPPMIIIRNLQKASKCTFPAEMAVSGTIGGTITKVLMVEKVLNRRPGAFFGNPKTLLIMDTAPDHLGDEVKEPLKEKNIDIMYIGGGLTSILQFIDTYQ